MYHPWDNSTIFYQQDKEVGINPDFEGAQAGNPLCRADGTGEMKKSRGRPVKVGVERHIRITDSDMADKINSLMRDGGYGNFNKVISDALFYGLPILRERVVGGMVTEEEQLALFKPRESGSREEEFYAVATRLMREIALNAAINKSILSSLYNFIYGITDPRSKEAQAFYSGRMSDTPEYLEEFEVEGMKNVRK